MRIPKKDEHLEKHGIIDWTGEVVYHLREKGINYGNMVLHGSKY